MLVSRLQAAIGAPMHPLRLGRESVIQTKRPRLSAHLFEAGAQPPANAGIGEGRVLVLALVASPPATPATEVRAAVQDPAAPATARATEPMPQPLEPRPCRHDGDQIVDLSCFLSRPTVPIAQPDPARLQLIADGRSFFAMT